ncbi:MAG: DUF928 domain-containing protein [Myxococcota bacterium]
MKALVALIALCLALASSTVYAVEKEAVKSNAAKRTDMPVFKPTNVGALIGVDPINPILETTLEGPFEPGIQRIRLADHGVTLQPAFEYQWFVRVIPNPDQRLYDRVVGGGIQRLAPSAELDARLAAAQQGDAHYVLAEAGIWYDALDSLSLQIEAAPENENLRAQRAALFDQVGLENLK